MEKIKDQKLAQRIVEKNFFVPTIKKI
jgi:hypothetical protein